MHGSHRTRAARTDEPVSAAEAAEFIVAKLALAPAPARPEIRLGRAYLPHGQLRLIAQYPSRISPIRALPHGSPVWSVHSKAKLARNGRISLS